MFIFDCTNVRWTENFGCLFPSCYLFSLKINQVWCLWNFSSSSSKLIDRNNYLFLKEVMEIRFSSISFTFLMFNEFFFLLLLQFYILSTISCVYKSLYRLPRMANSLSLAMKFYWDSIYREATSRDIIWLVLVVICFFWKLFRFGSAFCHITTTKYSSL